MRFSLRSLLVLLAVASLVCAVALWSGWGVHLIAMVFGLACGAMPLLFVSVSQLGRNRFALVMLACASAAAASMFGFLLIYDFVFSTTHGIAVPASYHDDRLNEPWLPISAILIALALASGGGWLLLTRKTRRPDAARNERQSPQHLSEEGPADGTHG